MRQSLAYLVLSCFAVSCAAPSSDEATGSAGEELTRYVLRLSSPSPGASVPASFTLAGNGPGFLNVEAFTGDGALVARTTPRADGAFSIDVDATELPSGTSTLTVRAWDSPAGTPYAHTSSLDVVLTRATDVRSAPGTTRSGVPLPAGFALRSADDFGTAGNVRTHADLHAKYYEGQFYNRDPATGLVWDGHNHPERYITIQGEQERYVHFEQAIAFSSDHLTIQGRGHADGSITSAEMVSRGSYRSFCVEAKYRVPATDKSWPAFWFYGATSDNDSSEIDFEQPNTSTNGILGVHDVSMFNHPDQWNTGLSILDGRFTADWMVFHDVAFDASARPHAYAVCYDDATHTAERWIDGRAIYVGSLVWDASGGHADACTILNLAVGGAWPGNTAHPAGYVGDYDVWYVDTYTP